jgi:hypothetical protein
VSLLSYVTDVVLAFPEVESTDEYGNPVRVPGGTSVEVPCRVQPVSAEEAATLGQETSTVYRILSATWPTGAFGMVTWDGRDWDIEGEPRRSRGSAATAHVTVLIKARKPQAV